VHTTQQQQQQQQQQTAAMSETNLQLSLQLVELKGSLARDFRLLVFFMDQFPQCPEYPIEAFSNFYENSRRYSQLCVYDTGDKLFTGNKLSHLHRR
jgi:hypothetical protein